MHSSTKGGRCALGAAIAVIAAACGGSGGNGGSTSPPPPPAASVPGLVSVPSPFAAGCGLGDGTVFINAEVEPYLAVNPRDPRNLVGVWQQDRWSNGSARGVLTAASFDGGTTWSVRQVPFSRCAGGPFERATDPWVSFGPDGTVHQMALVTLGGAFQPGATNAMQASRSLDGGLTWSAPATLISDTGPFFNDKNSMTADPLDGRFVYAAWDRLRETGGGPAYFTRSTDGGLTWEAARAVFDPGNAGQAIGSLVVVLPDGALAYFFTRIDASAGGVQTAAVELLRSTDRGLTWGAPIRVAQMFARGARDPETNAAIRDGSILPQATVAPDGTLYAVWQDARFSGGARDAIALARSNDRGASWSAPVRVNADANVQAFTPQVHVRSDGTIGVTYYDLRSNTADPATLPTDYWLARSTDAVNWSETRVAGPFNLNTAPNARGLFLGDYMGLASDGASFLPFYTRTTGDAANPTDVFLARIGAAGSAESAPDPKRATPPESRLETRAAPEAPPLEPDASFRARVSENIERVLERRVPGWAKSRGRASPR